MWKRTKGCKISNSLAYDTRDTWPHLGPVSLKLLPSFVWLNLYVQLLWNIRPLHYPTLPVSWWSRVRRIERTKNNLLTKLLNRHFCDFSSIRPFVIITQNYSMMSSRPSLLNWGFEMTELVAINFNNVGYISRKQFVADDTFFIPPYAQQLSGMNTSFYYYY